jgi:hypothetical protein
MGGVACPRNSAQSPDAAGPVIAERIEFTYNPIRQEAREPRRAATQWSTTNAIQFHR